MNTGNSKIRLVQKTFARGQQRWRVDHNGNWSCYMWGWWPNGSNYPSGRYVSIGADRVPEDILEAASCHTKL